MPHVILVNMDLSKITDWIKLKPRYLVGLTAISTILLFAPSTFINALGLTEILEAYRGWVGGAFLISGILLGVHVLAYLGDPIERWFNDRRFIIVHATHLKELSPGEKTILRRYVDNDTRTQELNISDGVAQGLVGKKILIRTSTLGDATGWFDHNIQPWAWNYLKKHPQFLNEKSPEA